MVRVQCASEFARERTSSLGLLSEGVVMAPSLRRYRPYTGRLLAKVGRPVFHGSLERAAVASVVSSALVPGKQKNVGSGMIFLCAGFSVNFIFFRLHFFLARVCVVLLFLSSRRQQ